MYIVLALEDNVFAGITSITTKSFEHWRPTTRPSTALYKGNLVLHTFCSQLDLEEAATSLVYIIYLVYVSQCHLDKCQFDL